MQDLGNVMKLIVSLPSVYLSGQGKCRNVSINIRHYCLTYLHGISFFLLDAIQFNI